MGSAPDSTAQRSLAATVLSYRSPPTTRSTPYERICSILAGEQTVGTKIRAGIFNVIAAKATAAPWLPPDAATTPDFGISRVSRFVNAPRALNDPARCVNSSLSVTRRPGMPISPPSTSTTGVRRMYGAMTACTRSMSARAMEAVMTVMRIMLTHAGPSSQQPLELVGVNGSREGVLAVDEPL